MPKYRVELSDGRTFDVEADSPPSEADVLKKLGMDVASAESGPTEPPKQRPPWQPVSVLRQGRESAAYRGPENVGTRPIDRLGQSLAANPMIQGAARPDELGDILGLVLPNVGIGTVTRALPSASEMFQPIRNAAAPVGRFLQETAGPYIRDYPITQPLKVVGDVVERVGARLSDTANFARDNRLLGRTGAMPQPVPSPVVAEGRDFYQLWKEPSVQPVAGPVPRLVPGGAAPTVEAAIQQELQGMMGSRAAAPATTTAPVPSGGTMTAGGRPSVSAAEQAAIEASAANARPIYNVSGPAPRLVPGGTPTVEAAVQQELQNLMGSRAVPARSTAPVPSGSTMTAGGHPSVTAAEQAAIEAGAASRPAAAAVADIAPVAAHAPTTSGPAANWSGDVLKGTVDKAAKRVGVQLTDTQSQQVAQLIREGHPPVSAVQRVQTMSEVQKLSAQVGSEKAAKILGTTKEHIKELRGPSISALPERARAAIDAKLATLTDPAAIDAYIAAAPNEVTAAYLRWKTGR